MKQIITGALVLTLASCGARQAGTSTTATRPEPAMKLIDAALEPGQACQRWAELLVRQPHAVPLTAGTTVAFHGRLTGNEKAPVPEPIRATDPGFVLDFDIDVARRQGDGVRCGGMFMAYVEPNTDDVYPLDEEVIDGWLADRHVEVESFADGQWLAMFFMDVDLVPHAGGLAASRAFIALESEAYRTGDSTAYYVAWFEDPELEDDVDGDGDEEFVIFASEHEELTSPMVEPAQPGDRLEETTDAKGLVVHDRDFRFTIWETYNSLTCDNVHESAVPAQGDYELLDLGIGRTVFAWMDVGDSYELACTEDGEEQVKSILLYDLTTYRVLDDGEWDVIFSWGPQFPVGQPCAFTPEEVTIMPIEVAGGPWEVHVVHEWDAPMTPDRTEIYRFDGTRYTLAEQKTEK
jgi:hypothetical protein